MNVLTRDIALTLPEGRLSAHLTLPRDPHALVIAASAGPYPDNVGAVLVSSQFALLSIDLLTRDEQHFDRGRGNAPLLATRLLRLLDHIRHDGDLEGLIVGLHAAGHAAPAGIRVAAQRDATIRALVTHGGLIDHAGLEYLEALVAPLLILTDDADAPAESAIQRAVQHIGAPYELRPAADHAQEARAWFERWLVRS